MITVRDDADVHVSIEQRIFEALFLDCLGDPKDRWTVGQCPVMKFGGSSKLSVVHRFPGKGSVGSSWHQ